MLKGIPDDRDGLFDTIQRSKNHYQKRAYQCIKCMVALFSNCSVAYQILQVRRCCRESEDVVHLPFFPTVCCFKCQAFEYSRLVSTPPSPPPPRTAEQRRPQAEVDVGRGVAGRRAGAEAVPREPPVHLQQLVPAGAEQRDVQRLLPGAVAQRAHDAGQSLRTLSRGGNAIPPASRVP